MRPFIILQRHLASAHPDVQSVVGGNAASDTGQSPPPHHNPAPVSTRDTRGQAKR